MIKYLLLLVLLQNEENKSDEEMDWSLSSEIDYDPEDEKSELHITH